jgi:integrase
MPRIKVTQKTIEALVRKGHDRQTDYTDSITPGLAFRIGPRAAAWYYLRRVDGKLHRLRLGRWPTMKIKAARDAVGEIEADVEAGKHPKTEQARRKTDKRDAREFDHARLFENVTAAWCDHHLPDVADQTRKMYRRAVRRLEDEFSGRDISTISRGELVRFLDRLKAASRSGVPANHAAAVIRLVYAYAVDRLELPGNPAAGLKNPAKVKPRDRILDRAEIRIVWEACIRAGYPHGHALRFQLCTGQRIGEVGGMLRSDVEGDFWRLSRTKTGKRIDVYLASHSRAILEDCLDFGNRAPYFSASGGRIGLRADGFHNALSRHIRPHLDDVADELELPRITEHWTPHDLRRTVRSGLTGWCGVFPDIAERTINHAVGGIRAVYDHADYRPHIAEALQAWDTELGRILAGKQATVTPIKREAG